MIKFLTLFISLQAVSLSAQPLSISKEYWKDQSFRKAFNGSYGTNARIEPTVTATQRALNLRVQAAMQKGDREGALRVLKTSAATNKSAALLFNKGNILFELGRMKKAVAAYQEALKLYPSFRRAHKNLGTLHLQDGKTKESMASLQKALQLGDNSGSTMGMLGYCYLQQEKYASALQAYRMAQLTEPDVIDWKAGTAQCLAEIGNDSEALALLEEVIELRPNEASYQLLFVNVLLKLEREEEASTGLELLRRNDQLEPSSLALLARLHTRSDALKLAKPIFTELQKTFNAEQLPSYLQAVESVIQQGEWQYAEELLGAVSSDLKLSQKVKNKQSRLKAFVMIQQGKEGAEVLLREITSNDPNDGDALMLLADYQQANSKPEEAGLLYERATKLGSFAYRAQLAHGKMLVTQQRYSKAVEKLTAAEKLQSSAELKRYLEAVQRVAVAVAE